MNQRSKIVLITVALLTLVISPVARAEEENPTTEEGINPVESDMYKYWGKVRDVGVFQKKLFTKDGHHELGLSIGIIPNDPFLTYFPIGLRYDYFFVEDISIEVNASYVGLQSNSDLTDFLLNENKLQVSSIEVSDKAIFRAAVDIVWAPFYGKFAILNRKISHFDINLAAGLGMVFLEKGMNDATGETEYDFRPEVNLGLGFRFFLVDWFCVRIDFRQYIYPKENQAGDWDDTAIPSELTLGFGFLL